MRITITRPQYYGYSMGSLQFRIVLHMAVNEAASMNYVNNALGASYKNVHTAHQSLIKKGLVRKIPRVGHDSYWLTKAGVALAASEGTNIKKMKELLPKYFKNFELKKLFIWLKFGEILGPDYLKALVRSKSSEVLDQDLLLIPLDKPDKSAQLLEEISADSVTEKRVQELIRELLKTELIGSFIKNEVKSAMKEEY